ncbi:tripartite tricarboxylate transporter substrate binding protein [Bordetella genomosp. 12]|uniref:Receptor n=1 Tax=Bordetella genomosp. 12 TaxID=463035 RepID=A0A261VBJ5_9BORD|nr:tripartite tricarboxylate transporter substrate binding protein [Bordetella genomosp. 12]OZI71459.1 receptor [Bordetella genomosp. 12]
MPKHHTAKRLSQSATKQIRVSLITLVSTLCIANPVLAQATWKPERQVTIVVPYVPGGGTDATARATAKLLGEQWGQPVVVLNMAGADGLIGTRHVTDSKPDGYTLLLQTPAIVLTKHTPAFSGTDPLSRLEPVTNIAQSPGVIVGNGKFPASSLPELISYCKTAPSPCSMGTGENVAKLFGQQLKAESLPDLIVVNYKGTAAIITDMIANNVNFAVTGVASALPHQKSGSLKIIANQGTHRFSQAPEVPTVIETGMPEYEYTTWFGLFAPKGTPPEVIQGIYSAVKEATGKPELQKAIITAGAEPLANTPADFASQIQKEDRRFTSLAKRFPLE